MGDSDVSLVSGTGNAGVYVNGEFVVVGLTLLVLGARSTVYGSVVRRTEAFTVLTFGNVNGAVVSVVGDVYFNVRVCVLCARCGRSGRDEVSKLLVLGWDGTGVCCKQKAVPAERPAGAGRVCFWVNRPLLGGGRGVRR